MTILFWILIALVIYAYLGYPLLLYLIATFYKRPVKNSEICPFISMVIAAHNEEKGIEEKLKNTLNLEYPKDRLEIIVASDNSTDKTNELVLNFKDERIRLHKFDERNGKTFVQNEAVKQAKGEIILFSDATTLYQPQLLKKIVRNFADPQVGVVGGELVYINKNQTPVGEGGGFYWRYEKFLKRMESQINSLIGVSGCCYAIRKELYEPIRQDLISDFVIAQISYKKGKRAVYEPEAISYEETNDTVKEEFEMRKRIAIRTLYGIWHMKGLLNPFRYGLFSLQLISHKILRYLVPLFLILIFFLNFFIYLSGKNLLYSTLLFLQLTFLTAVFLAWSLNLKNRIFQIPLYFSLTNFSLLIAMLRFLSGDRQVVWKPLRK